MNHAILVSIIIPVYNMEKYLAQCLESVLNQSYQNVEVLVIDDGSADKSGIIAEGFANKDSRFSVIRQSNGGVSSARNIGIQMATGDYIAFLDADDLIHDTYVSIAVQNLQYSKADIMTSRKAMSSLTPNDFLNKDISQEINYVVYEPHEAIKALYNGTLEKSQNGCQVFSSSLLKESKILYDTSMSIGEDFDFFARAILKSNRVIIDQRDMYFYRRNDESAVHKPFNIKQFDAIANVQKAGRSIDGSVPGLDRILDNNLLVNSISYGALMYSVRNQYPNEFSLIQGTLKKGKWKALRSYDLKLNSRLKVLIVACLGVDMGLRAVKKLIKL